MFQVAETEVKLTCLSSMAHTNNLKYPGFPVPFNLLHQYTSKLVAESKQLMSFCHLHAHPEVRLRKQRNNRALTRNSFAECSLCLCAWGKCACGDPGEDFHFSRGKLAKISVHISWKSLVIEDTPEKIWELGPHVRQMLHFALDRILATRNISHLEPFPWGSVFLIKNEGCSHHELRLKLFSITECLNTK